MTCDACERIRQIRQGTNPHFIAELSESYAVLADEQAYEGWCILLLKDHHEHLGQLPLERQLNLWRDVARTADAQRGALSPVRINYECLGNQLHHIHWHVIPRYADDPSPTSPVWLRPPDERKVVLPPPRRDALVARLRDALNRSANH